MYINHLIHLSQFDELRESDQTYVVMKYSPRCPLCLDKLGDLFKWMSKSKVQNVRQLNVLDNAEIKEHLTDRTDIVHKSPQLLLIQNKKVICYRDENNIDIQEMSDALTEHVLA